MRRRLAAHVLAMTLIALPASAQVMADPDVVGSFLETYGLTVRHAVDDAGDPMLSSRLDDTNFSVYFYGCTAARDCSSIAFSAVFEPAEPIKLYSINAWNRDARFGRAYLDAAGNANLEYDVNLDRDGVGGKNFTDTLDIWRGVLEDFRHHINW